MIRAIKIAIYSYIHFRGWCKKLHKEPKEWRSGCPIVDSMMFLLFPIYEVKDEVFKAMVENNGLSPATIVRKKD